MSKSSLEQSVKQLTDAERVTQVRSLIGLVKSSIARALPATCPFDPDQFCQLCMTVFLRDLHEGRVDGKERLLIWCDDDSIQRVCVQAAEVGLQPGSSLGHCYFIPRGGSVSFQIGVWGWVALMVRHPSVKAVHTDVIYQADKYLVRRGLHPEIMHEPAWTLEKGVAVDAGGRGILLGSYAVLTYADGSTDFVVLSASDIAMAHAQSKAPGSPAWKNFYDEMAQRSAITRGQKKWPKSTEVGRALELEENDQLRADLEEMLSKLKAIPATGEPVGAQQKKMDDVLSGRGLPAPTPSAREQMEAGSLKEPELVPR